MVGKAGGRCTGIHGRRRFRFVVRAGPFIHVAEWAGLRFLSSMTPARLALAFFLGAILGRAAEPPGYYDRALGLSGGPLKAALHEIIKGHVVTPYAQLHPPMARLHEDPANPANVLLVYSRDSVPKGTDFTAWNREHGWPRSRGNSDQLGPDDSDMHYIFPCYGATNTARGNLYYDVSDRTDPGFRSPGHALAPLTTLDPDSWEPAPGDRGLLARALFYIATRYDGDEPFTTDMELVSYVPGGAQMGNLNTLLRWHAEEPVTAAERRRNDLIHSDFQRNRNPFIDHPEWVAMIWGEPGVGSTGPRPLARVDATIASASELPRYPGEFKVTLAQSAPAGGVRIQFQLTGTTAAAIDYSLSGSGVSFNNGLPGGSVLIPAGAGSATISVLPFADSLTEAAETVTLLLVPDVGYTVVPNSSQRATVTITDLPQLPAAWRFDAGAPYANPLPADSGSALMRFDAWGGSITSFSGASGDALALVGSAGNGSSLLISFSMAGLRDLSLAFQTRGTATGFTSGTWAWSVDGAVFTPVPGVDTASTSSGFVARAVNFSSITTLNNASNVTLRYTLSGATGTAANARIDDLVVTAQPIAVEPDIAPQIVSQLGVADGVVGGSVSLFVNAFARPAPSYQWFKDGSTVPGGTGATLSIPLATASDAGVYTVVVTNARGRATSAPIPLTLRPSVSRLINVASRGAVGAGDAVLIAGFVIGGTQNKSVLVRGAGPALAPFGVADRLADPILEIYQDSVRIAENDDWPAADAATHTAAGAFSFPVGSKDAALVRTLAPGAYTVLVRTASTGPAATGVALVEVFELEPATSPTTETRLVNLSTRAFVGAGQNILIPGVVIGPPAQNSVNSTRLVLIRAVGPGLAEFGVGNALARPRLTVLRSDRSIAAENTGWQGTANREAMVAAAARVGAFPLSATNADSALLLPLNATSYTIQVSGADGGTGVALVEVYEVP